MEAHRFDVVTVAVARTRSRRDAIRVLAGVALPVIASDLGTRVVGATHFDCRHVGVRCRRARQCCSNRCARAAEGQPKTCQGHDGGICQSSQDACAQGAAGNNLCGQDAGDCFCWKTTGGAPYCGEGIFCPFEPCKKDKDCVKAFKGLPNAESTACIDCPGCGGDGGFCANLCPNPK
jgi:hypothetical protein